MHDPSHGSGQEVEAYFAGRVGSGQEVFEISRVGSCRVGSDRVGSGRVGSGRVGSGRVASGRVGSGRVASGQDIQVKGYSSMTRRVGSRWLDPTRKKFFDPAKSLANFLLQYCGLKNRVTQKKTFLPKYPTPLSVHRCIGASVGG